MTARAGRETAPLKQPASTGVGAAVAKLDDGVRAKLIDGLERPRGDVFAQRWGAR